MRRVQVDCTHCPSSEAALSMKRLINGTCHVRGLKKEIAMSLSRLQRSRSQHINRARFETLEARKMLSFSPAASFAVGTDPQAVVTADFNNDGKLDLATS